MIRPCITVLMPMGMESSPTKNFRWHWLNTIQQPQLRRLVGAIGVKRVTTTIQIIVVQGRAEAT